MNVVDYERRVISRYGETIDFNLDTRADRFLRFWLRAGAAECAERFFQARIFDHVASRPQVSKAATLSAFDETLERLRTWPHSAPAGLAATLEGLRAHAEAEQIAE